MSDKLVWSSNGTHDHLKSLSREDRLANLPDYGYEKDMLDGLDDTGLDDIIDTSDYLWQIDSEDFENRIKPAISAQTEDGLVVVGDVEDPILVDDLVSCCDALYNRDGKLVTDTGDVIYFIDEYDYKIPIDADQLDVIEEGLNEAVTKDPETLETELEQIKPLADEYGFEFFSSMPFVNYEDDEQSLEYQYPEFFKICKAFFTEMEIVEDPDNIDELEDNWYTIDQHDWDTIIKVCDKLVANPNKSQQFEKVYSQGLKSHDYDDEVEEPDYPVETRTALNRSYEESLKEGVLSEASIFDKITNVGLKHYGIDESDDEDVKPDTEGTVLTEEHDDEETMAERKEADYQAYLKAKAAGEFDDVEVDEALERNNKIKAFYRAAEGLGEDEDIVELQEAALNRTSCYWQESLDNLKHILLDK